MQQIEKKACAGERDGKAAQIRVIKNTPHRTSADDYANPKVWASAVG
jgi:hypothetical protein